jgi:hypothetical protein
MVEDHVWRVSVLANRFCQGSKTELQRKGMNSVGACRGVTTVIGLKGAGDRREEFTPMERIGPPMGSRPAMSGRRLLWSGGDLAALRRPLFLLLAPGPPGRTAD